MRRFRFGGWAEETVVQGGFAGKPVPFSVLIKVLEITSLKRE